MCVKPESQSKWTVEMAVYGKPGKRSCCFPPFPQTLGIERTDSHIPTATTTTSMNISQNPSKPKPGEMMHNITTQVGQIKWSKWATPE
jgi:hypothetical protein